MGLLRRKLSLANVAASLAVFLALGAGYASAFSGSGTLQKGSLRNIPAQNKVVRELTGIGSIMARCQPNDLRVVFRNQSGETLQMGLVTGSQFLPEPIPHGMDGTVSPAADSHFRYHIYPVDGDKRPQADISVTIFDDAEDCATSQVSVLALNTEE